jgi:dTDP-4-amino-4,6-dideoxygalactose transaminase
MTVVLFIYGGIVENTKVRISKPHLGIREKLRVQKVLASGNLAQGRQVELFEKEFSRFVPERHCVAVNSGTSGLHLALKALGVGPGDEVIVPAFTFAATANVVMLVGASPVFVDIDPLTFNMNVTSIERLVTNRTKAIMPVHLYGQAAEIEAISSICKRLGLFLIEDAAQAHGAKSGQSYVGTFGDAAVFSFYPTKNVTSGEGGIIAVKEESVENRIRMLRNQGMLQRYANELPGFNMRLSDIHAAIGYEQVRKLETFNEKRNRNAEMYNKELDDRIVKPFKKQENFHVYHQYTVRVPFGKRDELAGFLKNRGIETGIYYPRTLNQFGYFGTKQEMPAAELASLEVLSLPIRPNLTRKEQKLVISEVNKFASLELR